MRGSRLVRQVAWVAGTLFAAWSASAGVSDGYYDPTRMGCTGTSDTTGAGAVPGCYTAIIAVGDRSGHVYYGAGARQVDLGQQPGQTFDVWVDPGLGVKYTFTVTRTPSPLITGPSLSVGTPAQPQQGVYVYFGADDNLENGEHDGSPLMADGPSDGGAISVDIDPATAQAWVAGLAQLDVANLLANPLPVPGAGSGACADGLCFGATAVRRVAYLGGKAGAYRDAPNYAGVIWDPESCDGENDGVTKGPANSCDDPTTPQIQCALNPLACNTSTINGSGYENIVYWHKKSGVVYVQPGINVFEDPNPQGSPIANYPIPALSLGTCGFIFGGGDLAFTGPNTNSAGQVVVPTACN
jgi:hypothetical protein